MRNFACIVAAGALALSLSACASYGTGYAYYGVDGRYDSYPYGYYGYGDYDRDGVRDNYDRFPTIPHHS